MLRADGSPAYGPGSEQPRPVVTEPETPAEGVAADEAPDTRLHVIVASGSWSVAYGPYLAKRAQEVASQLNAGDWMGHYWEAVPLGYLPGEEPPVRSVQRSVEEDRVELFKVLEERNHGKQA